MNTTSTIVDIPYQGANEDDQMRIVVIADQQEAGHQQTRGSITTREQPVVHSDAQAYPVGVPKPNEPPQSAEACLDMPEASTGEVPVEVEPVQDAQPTQSARVSRAAARAARHTPFYHLYDVERAEGRHNREDERNQRIIECWFWGSLAVLLILGVITAIFIRKLNLRPNR
jgi:hypothetical protein